MVLLPTLLAAHRGSGTMKALTPAGLTRTRQVSPLTPLCLPDIPTSTTRAARRSLCQSPQRHRLLPGFATNEQARHRSTPNQVRHPTDCRFISGCSPPRLTATQLPSITELATGSDTDFHHANRASSRSALAPAKAGVQGRRSDLGPLPRNGPQGRPSGGASAGMTGGVWAPIRISGQAFSENLRPWPDTLIVDRYTLIYQVTAENQSESLLVHGYAYRAFDRSVARACRLLRHGHCLPDPIELPERRRACRCRPSLR